MLGFVLGIACLSACAPPSNVPELGAVTGVVTLDGKALEEAQVKFYPNNGKTSYGMTDKDGRYELFYDKDVPGALLGYHTVVIGKTEMVRDTAPREMLPDRYSGDSQIRRQVVAGQNTFDFELESDPTPPSDEPQ